MTQTEENTKPKASVDPVQPMEPEVHPSSPPDGPSIIPSPSAPEPSPDPAGTAQQLENAGTSLDQPSS